MQHEGEFLNIDYTALERYWLEYFINETLTKSIEAGIREAIEALRYPTETVKGSTPLENMRVKKFNYTDGTKTGRTSCIKSNKGNFTVRGKLKGKSSA